MDPGFPLADFQHLEDSQPMRKQDSFPHSLIYLSTVFESVDQILLESVEILSDPNFLSLQAQGAIVPATPKTVNLQSANCIMCHKSNIMYEWKCDSSYIGETSSIEHADLTWHLILHSQETSIATSTQQFLLNLNLNKRSFMSEFCNLLRICLNVYVSLEITKQSKL